jgi:hypothetical protein
MRHEQPARSAPERQGGHAGDGVHDTHAGHSVQMFRDKFWITLALTIPTLIWGHMLQMALGYAAPWAAVLRSASTIIVAFNAQVLKQKAL